MQTFVPLLLNLKLVVLQVIKILKKINKFINSKSVILYSIFGFFEKKTLLPLPRILIDIWVYKYSLLTNWALFDQASETCSTDPSTDKRTDVWFRPSCIYTQIFSPKKTVFSLFRGQKKGIMQLFSADAIVFSYKF